MHYVWLLDSAPFAVAIVLVQCYGSTYYGLFLINWSLAIGCCAPYLHFLFIGWWPEHKNQNQLTGNYVGQCVAVRGSERWDRERLIGGRNRGCLRERQG